MSSMQLCVQLLSNGQQFPWWHKSMYKSVHAMVELWSFFDKILLISLTDTSLTRRLTDSPPLKLCCPMFYYANVNTLSDQGIFFKMSFVVPWCY